MPASEVAEGLLKGIEQDQHELVSLLTVHGGGHVVPQSIAKFSKLMGKVNLDFSTPREAVNFWRLTGG